ncbi:MAG: ATP-grasp domain-containing protein [Anaerolineae bacterium]|nr:ATP-grasp domain-containing protein [Anaerolineae bacterium]
MPLEFSSEPKRIILLMRNSTYRGQAFYEAAKKLDIEVVTGLDIHPDLADYWKVPLALQFDQLDESVRKVIDFTRQKPVQAVLSVDDSASLVAAKASEALGLIHNSSESALAARNKYDMRRMFAAGGVASPQFRLFDMTDDPHQIAAEVSFPCVVKPLLLSGSRGVMRANTPAELVDAFRRLGRMLAGLNRAPGSTQILVEDYIPGVEVALEGVIDGDGLKVLALFDKPDPLVGPFFEETIYVTPSRLPDEIQTAIATCADRAAQALGLRFGPVHAELRVNDAGPWLVEMAGRSIGGLCSRTLRFGLNNMALEELILRQAVGLEIDSFSRATEASGVMMIPIPMAGILKAVAGVEAAEQVPGIESVEITAKLNQPLTPLPEGDSYLGFIFARGETPDGVETALRQAHRQLDFTIQEMLPVI